MKLGVSKHQEKKWKEKYLRKFSNEVITANSIYNSFKGFANKMAGMLRTCSDY